MITIARLRRARDIAAEVVAARGEWALPIFERVERELEAAERRESALERARRIARERQGA